MSVQRYYGVTHEFSSRSGGDICKIKSNNTEDLIIQPTANFASIASEPSTTQTIATGTTPIKVVAPYVAGTEINNYVPNYSTALVGGTITVTEAGIYFVTARIEWGTNGNLGRYIGIYEGITELAKNIVQGVTGVPTVTNLSLNVPISAGGVISTYVYQNSGNPINITASYLSITKVGNLAV